MNAGTWPLQAGESSAAERELRWGFREWMLGGLLLQVLLILAAEGVIQLWPGPTDEAALLDLTTEMSFVEFQEIEDAPAPDSKELSDEILEVEKEQDTNINWSNAADPAMDFNQRYTAILEVNQSPDDYPSAARRANLGRVTAAVRLYIDSAGRIRDVQVHNLRSVGDAHVAFQADFVRSIRHLILHKTKLQNRPYMNGGVPKDFMWDTSITFTLQ